MRRPEAVERDGGIRGDRSGDCPRSFGERPPGEPDNRADRGDHDHEDENIDEFQHASGGGTGHERNVNSMITGGRRSER